MNTSRLTITLGCAALLAGICLLFRNPAMAQPSPIQGNNEYLTIRWGGRENTHIIRPGGQVEFIGMELRKLSRPDRADERSFFMNSAMNGLVKEGWGFAGMTSDEIIMRRPLVH